MTPEQQRKELAELDGFENVDIYIKGGPIPFCVSELQGTRDGLGESQDTLGREMFVIPNYRESFDAIIPLMRKQPRHIKYAIAKQFLGVFPCDDELNVIAYIDCDAAQLCEALLRAHGKWIED